MNLTGDGSRNWSLGCQAGLLAGAFVGVALAQMRNNAGLPGATGVSLVAGRGLGLLVGALLPRAFLTLFDALSLWF